MNTPQFDSRIAYMNALVPLVLAMEAKFGPKKGAAKKAALEAILRTNTAVASSAYGVRYSLDPRVKALRPRMIDKVVHNLILNGLLPATEEQKATATAALGLGPALKGKAKPKSTRR